MIVGAMPASRSAAHVAFYGTLMSGFEFQRQLGVHDALRLVGSCRIAGRLYDMGEWPTLVLGGGVVHGELFEVLDGGVFVELDRFEECYPEDLARSRYLRQPVALIAPAVRAWVYVANEPVPAAGQISSGSWYERVGRPDPR
jgi:gamma-glutamylcyclotransferase (GGCT)/AIG2-like uncharacterized protein YtfP